MTTSSYESLSHAKWDCKYHVVFIPKGRKKALQGSSWFPLHICGVKPTVSEELQFNQHVCGAEAKHTLHPCETARSYCRTSGCNFAGVVAVIFALWFA